MTRLLVGLALALAWAQPARAITILRFESEPGDWIGQGDTRETSLFWAVRRPDRAVGFIWPAYFELALAAPFAEDPVPGKYPDAAKYPTVPIDRPRLNFSGSGRGCSEITGGFEVFEAAYDTSGDVLAFAADFVQRCDDSRGVLRGQVRYNSSVPLPEPAGLPVWAAPLLWITRRRGRW